MITSLSSFQLYCHGRLLLLWILTVFPCVKMIYPFPVGVRLDYVACSGHLNMSRSDVCHFWGKKCKSYNTIFSFLSTTRLGMSLKNIIPSACVLGRRWVEQSYRWSTMDIVWAKTNGCYKSVRFGGCLSSQHNSVYITWTNWPLWTWSKLRYNYINLQGNA